MAKRKSKLVVTKTTPDEEQRQKDEAFLKLRPIQRLIIHEQMRKRIWGDKYNDVSLKRLRVIKQKATRPISPEKYLIHQQDILALKRILKSR